MLFILCLLPAAALPQEVKSPQRGFAPGGSYHISDFETINTTNANLMLQVPLASLPPGRGGLSAGISLRYNSKLWDAHTGLFIPLHNSSADFTALKRSGDGGWRYGIGYVLQQEVRPALGPQPCGSDDPKQADERYFNRYKIKVTFPDGGAHVFYPIGAHVSSDDYSNVDLDGRQLTYQVGSTNAGTLQDCEFRDHTFFSTTGMTYYTTDGTFLRLEVAHDGDRDWTNNAWTLSFPNGMRVKGNVLTAGGARVQQIYDSNDNFVEIRGTASGMTVSDQFGRSVSLHAGVTPNEDHVTATGFNGSPLRWTVRWKEIRVRRKYDGGMSNAATGGTPPELNMSLRVVDRVILPPEVGALSYTFGYNAQDVGSSPSADPNYYSHGWGEVSSVTVPSGAKARYSYRLDGAEQVPPWEDVLINGPAQKEIEYLAEYDGGSSPVTERWAYSYQIMDHRIGGGHVTGPDGGVSKEVLDSRHNLTYSEGPDGTAVERVWADNAANVCHNGGDPWRTCNPYVKTEFRSVRGAGGAFVRTAITDYTYDKNGNLTRRADYDWVNYGDVVRNAQGSPTGAIPDTAQLKRVAVSGYYNQTPEASVTPANDPSAYYRVRGTPRILNAIRWSEMGDAGRTLARTEFFYDDPAARRNLIERRSWDSTKGQLNAPDANGSRLAAGNSISVTNAYDPAHHNLLVSTKDARGNETRYAYETAGEQAYLYPTEVKTAFGTPVEQTVATEYDFHTGLATRSVDPNGVVSRTEYDVFGRPTLAVAAEGTTAEARAETEYSDAARRVVRRRELCRTGDPGCAVATKLVSVEHYDQLGRIRLARELEDAAYQSETAEAAGIKVQTRYLYSGQNSYRLVSNPYRAATSGDAAGAATMGWMVTKLDRAGRTVEVRTVAGAPLPAPWGDNINATGTITTAYDAEFTTVTDQAGKVRRSMTSALGLLARVDEPDQGGNLGTPGAPAQPTSYAYDALGNLTQVQQGTQTRTFSYSSLSRLVSAANPESGTTSYAYDANGNPKTKTDARGVTITYDYDELNRNVRVDYSDTAAINPDVSRFYDNPAAGSYGKGRFWYDYAGGSETAGQTVEHVAIDAYDALGRPLARRQHFKAGGAWSGAFGTALRYNRAGGVVSQTYPSGRTVSYGYDAAGRLASLAGNLGDGAARTYADQISYDEAGRVREERFGTQTSLYHKLQYNARGQLFDVRLSTVPSAVSGWDWDRGALTFFYGRGAHGQAGAHNNGNVTRAEHWVPTDPASPYGAGGQEGPWVIYATDYQYDTLNRLSRAAEVKIASGGATTASYTQAYTYDRWGNRQINAGETTGGVNESQFDMSEAATRNRLLAPGDAARSEAERQMRYDGAGNLVKDSYTGAGERTYDAENRMITGVGTSALTGPFNNRYAYDADGRRVRRVSGSGEVWQVYGIGGELSAEYAAGGAATAPRKEYAYRRGALLVVAEPPGATSAAPANLAAASAASAVTLNWAAAAGAVKYRVERSADKNWSSPAVFSAAAPQTTYADSSAAPGAAYLFRVCAADSSNNCVSAYSNAALGAARAFTDPQIVTYSDHQQGINTNLPLTAIKAAHVYEMREAVNAVRQLAGLAPAAWAEANINGAVIKASHVVELRGKLGEALSALGLPAPSYTDQTLSTAAGGTVIKRAHLAELRQAATRGAGAGSAGTAGAAGGVNWLVSDLLGTPRMTVDQTGSLQGVRRHDYLPFGEEIGADVGGRSKEQGYSGDSIRQKFTGKERDNETGLDYFLARYYSPAQGRFTSPDKPFADQFQANPQSWNLYSYVRNSPCNNIDAKGRCSAPAGLKPGQVGICIEAFIAAKEFKTVGYGDNRPHSGDDPKLSAKFRTDIILSRSADNPRVFDVSQKTKAGLSRINPLAAAVANIPAAIMGSASTTLNGVSSGSDGSSKTTVPLGSDGVLRFNVSTGAENGYKNYAFFSDLGTIRSSINFEVNPNTGVAQIDGNSQATAYPSFGIYTYAYDDKGNLVTREVWRFDETTPDALTEPMRPIPDQTERKPKDP